MCVVEYLCDGLAWPRAHNCTCLFCFGLTLFYFYYCSHLTSHHSLPPEVSRASSRPTRRRCAPCSSPPTASSLPQPLMTRRSSSGLSIGGSLCAPLLHTATGLVGHIVWLGVALTFIQWYWFGRPSYLVYSNRNVNPLSTMFLPWTASICLPLCPIDVSVNWCFCRVDKAVDP